MSQRVRMNERALSPPKFKDDLQPASAYAAALLPQVNVGTKVWQASPCLDRCLSLTRDSDMLQIYPQAHRLTQWIHLRQDTRAGMNAHVCKVQRQLSQGTSCGRSWK